MGADDVFRRCGVGGWSSAAAASGRPGAERCRDCCRPARPARPASPGDGVGLDAVASFCGLRSEDVAEHAELLVAADWLAEADTAGGTLRGRLGARILPLSGLL
ncbi:hypothetical protein [Streptomyces sp. DZ1-3]|uniref:hypothetical protein n=1 Tax=Streptomyces sp. DZ1-3 TaxID=3417466 RepID=UPI003CF99E68